VANIKSQIKRIKTNEKAQARNKSARSGLKTAIRRFKDAVAAGDQAAIKEELRVATEDTRCCSDQGSYPRKLCCK
jgi:small subunit ribosomal protein S20